MRQIALLLAEYAGWEVRSLSTTALEGDGLPDTRELLAQAGAQIDFRPGAPGRPGRWLAGARGISYELLEIAAEEKHAWEHRIGRFFERRLRALAEEFRPQVILTFGGDPTDAVRRKLLRESGAKVVFALHNLAYGKEPPPEVDAFLAPTRFLAQHYHKLWNEPVHVLPPPIDPRHAIAETPEPVCIGFCNPEPAKGAVLVAQLAQRIGRQPSPWPFLIIGGRAAAESLIAIGRKLGFDLAALPNLFFAPPQTRFAPLVSACRVFLVPSVVEEAAGRVAIEAMANGVVPLVSDRGGLPEIVGEAGRILSLGDPTARSWHSLEPFPEEIVDRWEHAIRPFFENKGTWEAASASARQHARQFLPDVLAPRYREWFRGLTACPERAPV